MVACYRVWRMNISIKINQRKTGLQEMDVVVGNGVLLKATCEYNNKIGLEQGSVISMLAKQ
jgi:hypothetical protein